MSVFHNNILAGASGAGGAGSFTIQRSLRFDSGSSSYLSRTPSSAGNRNTWTLSWWMKRSKLSNNFQTIFGVCDASATYYTQLRFGNTDKLSYQEKGSANGVVFETQMLFRDTSAWYHCVFVFNNTASSNSEKARLYVNGSEITDFSTDNRSQIGTTATAWNNNVQHNISHMRPYSGSFDFDGYLAMVNFVDGQALAATDFGEEDSNGVWQPKDTSGLTLGTNGFRLDFSDNSSASALGNDAAGSNNWTVNNISIGTSFPFSAEFDGSTSQYIRKAGDGVLPENNGNFTVECHFLPHTNSVRGLFDGGAGETSIIRNYDANAIGRQQGPTVDITGDYTVNDWNHMAACYNGSTDTLNVFINGTSSGTCSFSSYSGGSNFDIGTINAGGDGKFNGLIRNFRVTNTVVYSSNFTAPSHTSNLTNISGTQLLLFTTDANGLLTDGSSANRTLTNNGGVSPYIPGADNDSLIDTPMNLTADSGNNNGNYATLSLLDSSSNIAFANGCLDETTSTSGHRMTSSTIAVNSGKWYVEVTPTSLGGTYSHIGITPINTSNTTFVGNNGYGYTHAGTKQGLGTTSSYGNSYAAGDCIGIAFDADNGNLYFYKNGVAQNSGTAAFTGIDASKRWRFSISHFNGGGAVVNFGQRPFKYTNAGTNRPAATYLSLCTTNLTDPLIDRGATVFKTKTYSGTGSTQAIAGLLFSPDLVWIKNRGPSADTHAILDTQRGTNTVLSSNLTNGDRTESGSLTAFGTNGFTVGGYNDTNRNNNEFVAWTWDAGSGSPSTLTSGTMNSSVRVNTSAGFSICTYTSPNSSSNQSFAHGLNSKPDFLLVKNRDSSYNWDIYHSSLGYNSSLIFTSATTRSGAFSAEPTSTVVNTKHDYTHVNTDDYLALCWTAVEGYSAFGSYEGNGNDDGPFVYTGFRPAWILYKNVDSAAGWQIYDSTRDPFNQCDARLQANSSGIEDTTAAPDILSNGFKQRSTHTRTNNDADTYIYAAFAEHPFKTARAR